MGVGGPVAGKSQLLVIKWAVLKASRRDLVSGSCVSAFPRTSSVWPVICSHRYDPVRWGKRVEGVWAVGGNYSGSICGLSGSGSGFQAQAN